MAERYDVKVTKQAFEQMQKIVDYIANELFASDAANNLLDEMESKINSFAHMPKRMTLVEEEPWRTEGIRKAIVKNFLIYYWVDDEESKVQVIAVIYEKRDQIEQLRKIDIQGNKR